MGKLNTKALVEKWQPLMENEKVGTIKGKRLKEYTAIMLENQFGYLKEKGMVNEASFTSGSFGSDYATSGEFHKIAIPMVRRTFPELVAHDTVGVQPMTGPVGLAFALRYRAGQTYDGDSNVEVGYNKIDPDYTGSMSTSAGEELGSNSSGLGLGIGSGEAIKEVSLTVEKIQIEARTRKLRSRWSLEVAQDLNAMHGLSIEDEMMDILSYEIVAEIDREILAAIRSAAGNNTASYVSGQQGTLDWSASADFDGRWENEKYRNLYNYTLRASNGIAVTTRRGAGNFVVCNPTVAAAYESTSSFATAPVTGDVNTAITGVGTIGTLDGRMKVIRDTFATNDEFLVGYKGESPFDAGVIYLPYIQLMASKASFEDSFNPAMGLMSRYGLANNIFGAEMYYSRAIITNMP